MSNSKKPLAAALGAAFLATAVSPIASAEVNPFSASQLTGGYDLVNFGHEGKCGGEKEAEGKCGEGKCGGAEKSDAEGKCGEGKCGGAEKSSSEGKCGEGKCGGAEKSSSEGKCGEGKCGG